MEPTTLSRINSALVVVVGGMTLGHVLLPYCPGRQVVLLSTFYLAMALLGAMRGLRDATVCGVRGRDRNARAAVGAIAAVLLAWVAHFVIHG